MLKSLLVRHKPLFKLFSVLLCISILFTGGTLNAFAETQKPDYSNLIVEELEKYRTEYSKTYLRNDGTLETIVSASPLHFKELGAWVDYDNTLELNEKSGTYKNKKAPFSVELPDSTNYNKKITITKDDYTVELKLVGAKGVKSQKQEKVKASKAERKTMSAKEILNEDVISLDKIEYKEIYDNTTIEYEVDSASLKENIILNKAPKKAVSYTYQIRAEGMQIEKRDNGSIWFYPEEDAEKQNPIFYIPIPFMYDSNDEYSYDIETNLEIKNKKATLTYTPSFEWLTDSARAYPITIDPTVTMHNGIHDGYTYSAPEKQDAILGFEDQLKVGKSAWLSECDYFETYIKFDNLPEFPENYRLTSSSIMLTPKKSCGTWSEFIVGAYEITEDWQNVYTTALDSCLTYNNRPSASTTATSHAYFNFDFSGAPEAIDVTELTKAWYSGEKDNNGVKLSMVNETNNAWDSMIFHSSRNAQKAPYLSIEFSDTTIDSEKIEIINLPKNNKLYVGDKHTIETRLYPAYTVATGITYVSLNTEVATINENGLITAVSTGTAEIYAVDLENNLTDHFVLTVSSVPVKYFECEVPPYNTIKLGETFQVTNMPDVHLMARTPGVVAIDNNKGTVRGIGVGMTVIEYVRPGWDYFKSFELYVNAEIEISQMLPESVYTGEDHTVYKPDFIGYQYEVEFLTNNANIAYFTANEDNTVFEFHAVNPGTVNVVFRCEELGLYDQATITVKEKKVESIEIARNHSEYSLLYVGDKVEINATVLPTVALNREVEWGLSEFDIVHFTVHEQDSRHITLEALNPGKVTLYAFATDGSDVVGAFDITVIKPSIKITNIPADHELAIGETWQLGFELIPNREKITHWESRYEDIATIDQSGKITALATGTTTIRVSCKFGDLIVPATFTLTVAFPKETKLDLNNFITESLSAGNTTKWYYFIAKKTDYYNISFSSSNTISCMVFDENNIIEQSNNVAGDVVLLLQENTTYFIAVNTQTKCTYTIGVECPNDILFENIDIIHGLAKQYNANQSMRLCLQFLRKNRYNNEKWDTVAGTINWDFVDFVSTQNPKVYNYFLNNNIYIYDLEFGKVDFIHLCASMNANIYTGGDYMSLGVGERHVNNLSGWAGDLQTLMVEVYQATNATDNYDVYYQAFYSRMGDELTSFSTSDLLADVDSSNFADCWVSCNWGENLFGTACRYYYNNMDIPNVAFQSRSNCRFSQFLQQLSKQEYYNIVKEYTEQNFTELFVVHEWPLYTAKANELGINISITENQSRAAANAFVDYMWELKEREAKRFENNL